jgi:hypothetical protein
MVMERRCIRARSSRAAAVAAALLVVACGRSQKKTGDEDVVDTSGAGGDAGSGGSDASMGGASGSAGTMASGGSGAGGAAGGGTAGGGGAPATGGAGGSAGGAECTRLSDAYEAAFEDAKRCDPEAATPQCTKRLDYGFQCGEAVFVNPSQTDALAAIEAASQAYADGRCGTSGVICGASPNPLGANCSDAGECVTVYDNGGRGCMVAGVIYAHGTGGIPALDGCNQCSCDDGALACTKLACGDACPAPLVAGTQCAACGPTDACQLVEYACFAPCESTADCDAAELCVSSVCVTGVCG